MTKFATSQAAFLARAAALAGAAASLLLPLDAAPQESAAPPPANQRSLTMLWQRSVDPLISVTSSPQGKYLALITADGRLTLWNADTGKAIWAISGITAHDAVVSDPLGEVLVYDDMNRLDRRVSIYSAPPSMPVPAVTPPQTPKTSTAPNATAGSPIAAAPSAPARTPFPLRPSRIFSRTLGGAVWMSGVSLDGSYAACATGDRKMEIVELGKAPSLTTVSLDGLGNYLDFSSDNSYVAVGLWDQSGVETLDMAGRIRWSYLGAIDRRYDVSLSPDSRRVLSISYKNPNHSDPVLTMLNDQAAILWTYPLGADTYGAYARVASGIGITYVSYTAIVNHGRQTELERRLLALGPTGNPLWRRGGLFFKPTLLFVTADNANVIVYDGVQTLYKINQHGSVVSRSRLLGQLEYWTLDHARTRLITYTSDGQLTAYKLK